jgi:hypothetical protein
VSDANEFRKQAEDARQMATQSVNQEDKAFWLRLAEDWIKLAQDADKNAKRQGLKTAKIQTETLPEQH